MDETDLIPANSPSFEYVYVANQRCECGRTFRAFVKRPGRVCANCAGQTQDRAQWWLEALGNHTPKESTP